MLFFNVLVSTVANVAYSEQIKEKTSMFTSREHPEQNKSEQLEITVEIE